MGIAAICHGSFQNQLSNQYSDMVEAGKKVWVQKVSDLLLLKVMAFLCHSVIATFACEFSSLKTTFLPPGVVTVKRFETPL